MKTIKKNLTIALIMTAFITIVSCDFSKEETKNAPDLSSTANAVNTEKLNAESNKILVKYTKAVEAYKSGVEENLAYSKQMRISISLVKGPEWRKDLWNESLLKYKAKSYFDKFKKDYGEDKADALYLKISNIVNRKDL